MILASISPNILRILLIAVQIASVHAILSANLAIALIIFKNAHQIQDNVTKHQHCATLMINLLMELEIDVLILPAIVIISARVDTAQLMVDVR
jgi:hypothetical protein